MIRFIIRDGEASPDLRPDTFPRTPVPKFRTGTVIRNFVRDRNLTGQYSQFHYGTLNPDVFGEESSSVPRRSRSPETGLSRQACPASTCPETEIRGTGQSRPILIPYYNYLANIFALAMIEIFDPGSRNPFFTRRKILF